MNSMNSWDDLEFWSSKDWDTIQERLDDHGNSILPARHLLFTALDSTPLERCRVVILGQDPYCDPEAAMGLAFSVPKTCHYKPPSLQNLFRELCTDLHVKSPQHGDLSGWCEEGVLLWNAIPSVYPDEGPLSCAHWEWGSLTREILLTLCHKPVVFILMGNRARAYRDLIDHENSYAEIIETGHPSPLAVNSKFSTSNKFIGSRIYSRCNELLVQHRMEPINWSRGLG